MFGFFAFHLFFSVLRESMLLSFFLFSCEASFEFWPVFLADDVADTVFGAALARVVFVVIYIKAVIVGDFFAFFDVSC